MIKSLFRRYLNVFGIFEMKFYFFHLLFSYQSFKIFRTIYSRLDPLELAGFQDTPLPGFSFKSELELKRLGV